MNSTLYPVTISTVVSQNDYVSFVEAFLADQDIKENSKVTYKNGIFHFMKWLIDNNITRPRREDILVYKKSLEDSRLSTFTSSRYLVSVRRFFEWIEGKEIYTNIARNVKGFKKPKGFKKDSLSVEQIGDLLNSIDRSDTFGLRDYALLNLMVRTGLRVIEICRADIQDIRQEGGQNVLWVHGKGRDCKDEMVLLTHDTLKPILAYLVDRGYKSEQEPLFGSLSDRNVNGRLTPRSVSRIAKEALIDINLISRRYCAHSLRHTALTLSLKSGATIQETQSFARHSDINSTLIYAHNMDRIAHAPENKIEIMLRGRI